jgi:uncharacterized delta-60 repeat protein
MEVTMGSTFKRIGAGALLCAFLAARTIHAAPGDWDRSFGVDGRVLLNAGNVTFSVRHWRQQSDGRVVIAGHVTDPNSFETSEYVVARFHGNGTADTSFDGDGVVRFNFMPFGGTGTIDLALQSDGKVVVVAQAGDNFDHVRLLRFNADGSRDQGFAAGGELQLRYGRFAQNPFLELGPNGTVLVASRLGDWLSEPTAVITRVTSAGVVDASFGTAGSFELRSLEGHLEPSALAVLADGSMAVAGNVGQLEDVAPFVARVTADGRRVLSFGNIGMTVLPILQGDGFVTDLVATSDGKFVVAGRREDSRQVLRSFIARLNSNGVPDPSFGSAGRIILNGDIASLLVQADGRIVAAGSTSELAPGLAWIARYNNDGSPDLSFGLRGASRTDFSLGTSEFASGLSDLQRNADGSYTAMASMRPVVISGPSLNSSYALTRFLSSGSSAGVFGARSSLEASQGIRLLEGDYSLPVTIYRSGGAEGVVTVQYRVVGESAAAGQDFVADTGTVSFNEGELAVPVSIQVLDDGLPEPFEKQFYVELFAPTGGAALSKTRATFRLLPDQDSASIVEFASTETYVAESQGTARLVVNRRGNLREPLTLTYIPINLGSASPGSDFTGATGTISWPANEGGVRTFDVQIVDDGVSESTENFRIGFAAPPPGTVIGTLATANVSITDDDETNAPAGIGFSAGDVTVAEGAAAITLTLRRFGDRSQPVTMDWNTTLNAGNVTATAGQDYVASSGSLSWAAGDDTPQTISIPLLDDAVSEPLELFAVNIFAQSPASNENGGIARVFIIDNDGVPTQAVINIGSGTTVSEGAGTLNVPVTLTGSHPEAVSVRWEFVVETANGSDIQSPFSTNIFWPAGDSTPKTISIPIANDARDEIDETFSIRLVSPEGGATIGTATARFTITDDDATAPGQPAPVAPGVRALSQTVSANEDQQTLRLQVIRVGDLTGELNVFYFAGSGGTAAAPADYIAAAGSLRWLDNDGGVREVEVLLNGDTIAEPDETLTVRFDGFGGLQFAAGTATVTIVDDDRAIVQPALVGFMQGNLSVSESATTMTLQVARTGNTQVASSVDYATANVSASGADYQATSGTLTWAANDTSVKLVTITLTPDSLDEPDEAFTVALSNVSSGTELDDATATVTITDDDVPPSGPSPAPPTSGGGSSGGGGGGGTQSALALLIYAALITWRRAMSRRRFTMRAAA